VRIAYLTADFGVPVLGTKGASAHVRGLVQALEAEGHDVLVLAAHVGGDSRSPVAMREVPFRGALQSLYETLHHEELCQGTRLLQDLRNLLYSSNLELQGRVLLEAFGPDLIYERHCLFSTAGCELARYFHVPLVLELNAPLVLEQQQMRGLSLPRVARTAERLVLTSADHVVVVSEALRTHETRIGVASDSVSVIPNAADTAMFHPSAQLSPIRHELGWNDRFVVGFVGSMKPWHGVDTMLHALQLLGGADSRFRLLLVGSGPQLSDLQQRVERFGLAGAVHMTGAVPHQAVPGLLRVMDVAVAPYAADAGEYFSPVKLFEYMAMALPVASARIGQVCDVIEDGRTGWLYTPGNASELAALIRRLEGDRESCRAVGAAARELVMREYTWRHNARRVLAIAEDLIARRHAVGRPDAAASTCDSADLVPAGGSARDGQRRDGVPRRPPGVAIQSEDISGGP
jgi:glycosyltransferase involved in cell wall biosynthesis